MAIWISKWSWWPASLLSGPHFYRMQCSLCKYLDLGAAWTRKRCEKKALKSETAHFFECPRRPAWTRKRAENKAMKSEAAHFFECPRRPWNDKQKPR